MTTWPEAVHVFACVRACLSTGLQMFLCLNASVSVYLTLNPCHRVNVCL